MSKTLNSKDREKKIEPKLVKEVKAVKGMCLKFLPFLFTGFPDRLCFLPGGKLRIVETKTKGGKLSPRQRIVCLMLYNLGFTVYVIDTDELLERFLNEEVREVNMPNTNFWVDNLETKLAA